MSRLHEKYTKEILPELKKTLGINNHLAVPRLLRVTINMGVTEGTRDYALLESHMGEMGLITGQKPVVTRAKKSIANFKLRAGDPIGCKVDLRGKMMYEFCDRFFNVVLPRIRDFRGLSPKSFDGRGNYTLGIQEQVVFPEIDLDKIKRVQGMDITFVTSSSDNAGAKELLSALGMPFKK
ncbi:MAG: 50S ribosomal protein L5 [Chlamydiota bacterium]|nr:50S ribosomal protein L5 [Chlamydiota bacterium]